MRTDSSSILADRRVREYLARQQALKAGVARTQEPASGRMVVITLSRQYGAGGHTVAELLVKRLGPDWTIWDRELIDAVAAKAEVSRQIVEALDERRQDWVREMAANLLAHKTLDAAGYKRHLAQVLLALAQQGKKIIVGRGSNFVLPAALNVRLEAALEFRIHATMVARKISRQEAMDLVLQSDRERADFCRGVFDRDIEDHSAYDMILQTDCLGYETCAEVILTAARCLFGECLG